MVSDIFPEGFTSPEMILETAFAAPCPPREVQITAAAFLSQFMLTGLPADTTAIMLGLTFATASTSFTWFSGIFMFSLSLPSASENSSSPRNMTTKSASAESSAASFRRPVSFLPSLSKPLQYPAISKPSALSESSPVSR